MSDTYPYEYNPEEEIQFNDINRDPNEDLEQYSKGIHEELEEHHPYIVEEPKNLEKHTRDKNYEENISKLREEFELAKQQEYDEIDEKKSIPTRITESIVNLWKILTNNKEGFIEEINKNKDKIQATEMISLYTLLIDHTEDVIEKKLDYDTVSGIISYCQILDHRIDPLGLDLNDGSIVKQVINKVNNEVKKLTQNYYLIAGKRKSRSKSKKVRKSKSKRKNTKSKKSKKSKKSRKSRKR